MIGHWIAFLKRIKADPQAFFVGDKLKNLGVFDQVLMSREREKKKLRGCFCARGEVKKRRELTPLFSSMDFSWKGRSGGEELALFRILRMMGSREKGQHSQSLLWQQSPPVAKITKEGERIGGLLSQGNKRLTHILLPIRVAGVLNNAMEKQRR